MPKRIALISEHASPLGMLGGVDSEMNRSLKVALGRTLRGPDWVPRSPDVASMSALDAARAKLAQASKTAKTSGSVTAM